MQCPKCLQIRYSRSWKPSQWRNERAVIGEFNCCRECHYDCFLSPISPEDALDQVRVLKKRYHHCAQQGWSDQLEKFFEEWVSKVPKYNRKYWSYFGALSRLDTDDPRGSTAVAIARWADTNRKWLSCETYFDPGNWHYSICMRLLWPRLGSQGNWNDETIGDIVESLLGMQYLIAHRPNELKVRHFPDYLVKFLHDWCYVVYSYFKSTTWAITDTETLRSLFSPSGWRRQRSAAASSSLNSTD